MNENKTALPATEGERALGTALNILAYAECTVSTLRKKLHDKGYDRESAEFAIEYVVKHRYLDEKRYLYRLVEYLGNSRLYGRRRIAVTVKEKGFSQKNISLYFEDALSAIDERENCRKALSKIKKDSYKKTVDALLRRGFLYGDVKTVLQEAQNEEDFD